MKHIYLNLKRFDIPVEKGGVNRLTSMADWGRHIIGNTQEELKKYSQDDVEFAMFFPELHVLGAAGALCEDSPVQVGCQGVFREDTAVGGNFGAFTTNRTANAMAAAGCSTTIIGHCEERKDKLGIMAESGNASANMAKSGADCAYAVNRLLNQEIRTAIAGGLKVLYCIGETSQEQPRWQEVLKEQLVTGLEGVDPSCVVIAYEPVWAIGPGKTPPDASYIHMIGTYIKEVTKAYVPGGMDVVYGGGLKADNAQMLASIPVINGGLIALTRFYGEIGFYPEEYLEIIRLYMGV